MKRILIILPTLIIVACTNQMYQQQYAVQAPSITDIQGQCIAQLPKFLEQTDCITNAVNASGIAPNAYVQEYLAYMQSLVSKVKHGSTSESNARLKLTSRLNTLRSEQQKEFATQQAIQNQRAAQTAEIISRNKPAQVDLYQVTPPVISPSVYTNCQTYGNQVNCTSR